MTAPSPSWLSADGATLRPDDPALLVLARLFAVVAPGRDAVPVTVERVTGGPGEPRTWEGRGQLWGSDGARFGIDVDTHSVPTTAWVAKPVTLASGIDIPGLSTDEFTMILTAHVAEEPWFLDGDPAPMLAMARHLVGPVRIGAKRMLVRIDVVGETLRASVDLRASLTPVERAALGAEPGPFVGTGENGTGENVAGGHGLGFTDLAGLFGNDHDPHADLAWLPEPLRDPVSLDELHLEIDADGLAGVGAAVGLGDHARWPLIPGFDALTVGDIVVRVDVDHPLDAAARFPRVSVSGLIGIGDATIGMRARWPDLAVEGSLREGPAIDLAGLLAAAHLPTLGEHAPRITELTFTARPGAVPTTFTLHARAADVFTIPIGTAALELRALELDLALEREGGSGGQDRSLSTAVRGELALAERWLAVRAASEHGGGGWTIAAVLAGKPLDLAVLATWIAARFGDHPLPRSLMTAAPRIDRLAIGFDTATRDASFEIVTELDLGGVSGELRLDLALAHHGADAYERTVSGRFHIGEHTFDVLLAQDSGATAAGTDVLVAAYRQAGHTTVGELLAAVGIDLPIPVALSDALLARAGEETVALVDMGVGLDLSRLPLVGPGLTGQTLTLALRLVAASDGWDAAHVGALNAHLPSGYGPLELPGAGTAPGPAVLPRAGLIVALTWGDQTVHLDLGVRLDDAALPPAATATSTTASSAAAPAPSIGTPGIAGAAAPVTHTGDDGDVTWHTLQRTVGPVHLRRVGARFDSAHREIELLLDGDLSLGGLTLSLDGLSVALPLAPGLPRFGLRGLGLDIRQSGFELGGVFLRMGEDEFAGAALLRTEKLSLTAIGAYGVVDGHPSLFVYAVLDYPLGGPAFFFVTGLAAGFGYNRALVPPEIEKVAEFPLVRQATAGASGASLGAASDLMGVLESFATALPPRVGSMFAAVGIRFTSFTLLDSFALLTVSWGTRLRIDLLGSSTLVAPTPVPGAVVEPVAEVHLAVHARFLPDEGFLGVDARLTSASYVLSKRCHLTGGAAFYSWFSGPHAGDFVLTLGGYHPAFPAPAHYPTVPRPAFQWQVTDEVALKGDLYFALTGHAVMAGGHLEATYTSGSIAAWFRVGADFLIAWQPFAYDARMYVSVGARWHALEFEVGADVHVWGPEFAGVAEVDLGLTSFTVHFGATRPPLALPVGWDAFRAASLPALDAVLTVSCVRGLVTQVEAERGYAAEWVVSAHDLVIAVGSQIPASGYRFDPDPPRLVHTVPGADHSLGVAPMGVPRGGLSSVLAVRVERLADRGIQEMLRTPVLKTVPTALWGEPPPLGQRPAADAPMHIDRTLAGFELRPPTRPAPTSSTARDTLDHTDIPVDVFGPGWGPEPVVLPVAAAVDPAEVARARAALLRELGVDPGEVRLGPDPDRMFLATPIAVALTVAAESS